MRSIATSVLSLFLLSTLGLAAPIRPSVRRGPITSVTPHQRYPRQGAPTEIPQAEIDSFNPSTHFAAATYCSLDTIRTWTCGKHCDATPVFEPSLVGGDGAATPQFFVGFDPSSNSVVVGHQGTDPTEVESLLIDAVFVLEPMNQQTFPGVPSGAQVHSGFQDAHALTAQQILAAVTSELAARNTEKVLVVGHSLGGALALLDGVFLGLKLPATTQLSVITYGMPRVGNQEFANFVDANVAVTRITNREDIVPIVPGRFLGFRHSSDEAHFDEETGLMFACPGQDNTDERCAVGDAQNIFDSNVIDHLGPYNGINIVC